MMSESVGGNLGLEVETVTLDGQRQEEYLASTMSSQANFTRCGHQQILFSVHPMDLDPRAYKKTRSGQRLPVSRGKGR